MELKFPGLGCCPSPGRGLGSRSRCPSSRSPGEGRRGGPAGPAGLLGYEGGVSSSESSEASQLPPPPATHHTFSPATCVPLVQGLRAGEHWSPITPSVALLVPAGRPGSFLGKDMCKAFWVPGQGLRRPRGPHGWGGVHPPAQTRRPLCCLADLRAGPRTRTVGSLWGLKGEPGACRQ